MAEENRRSPAENLIRRLTSTPDIYPHTYDVMHDAVLLVEMDAAHYREASFLDDRILVPGMKGAWLPSGQVFATLLRLQATRPVHFIFHTGHVGSTLISRLLDECGELLPLREPLSLRALADAHDTLDRPEALLSHAQFQASLAAFVGAWRRGYPSTIATVLKATSSAGRLAPVLLRHEPGARALYVNLRAEAYLATLLAGANSSLDLRGHGPARIRRLNARLNLPVGPLHAMSSGELAAMSWLCETLAQHDCMDAFPGRVLAVDFDEFLRDVPGALTAIWTHLLLPGTPRVDNSRLTAGLAKYSKAPEHSYSPALRAELLDEARRLQGQEIARGLNWLAALAAREPVVAALQCR